MLTFFLPFLPPDIAPAPFSNKKKSKKQGEKLVEEKAIKYLLIRP